MKKTIIARKVEINAPKQKVWEALSDFGNVSRLSPNIVSSKLTSEQINGVGATRHCDFAAMGAQVEERIVDWKEGKSFKIDIYETQKMPMIKNMQADFALTESGDKTIVSGIFSYGMSGLWGNLMNTFMMKKMNEKAWVVFLAGIKHHIETGEDVDKSTTLNISPVEMA